MLGSMSLWMGLKSSILRASMEMTWQCGDSVKELSSQTREGPQNKAPTLPHHLTSTVLPDPAGAAG